MFIELWIHEVLRASGAKCMDLLIDQYIALRWRAKQWFGSRVYKHLAPLEPEDRLVALPAVS